MGVTSRGSWSLVLASGLLMVSLLASLTDAVAASGRASMSNSPTCPSFSAQSFPRAPTINNRYFPLTPGDLYTYQGNRKKSAVKETVYVTRNTKKIAGVTTVEVRDRSYEDTVLVEDTLDWYAQDRQGNVWYFGEFSTEVATDSHAGSWTAGVDGAAPGYIMEAAPRVGDNYCQENAPGVAQDAAQVVSLAESRSVPFGSFSGNVLQTKDYSLLEPHSEYKYYAPGVGLVEAIALNGGSEDIQLTNLQHNR